MDLAWRLVVDFVTMGRSNELRCAVDPDSASVVIQDDKLPLSKSKYRVWAKALTAPVPQSQFDAVDKAGNKAKQVIEACP